MHYYHLEFFQLTSHRSFNDGKEAAIVRCIGTTQFWITSAAYAATLDTAVYSILRRTTGKRLNNFDKHQKKSNQLNSEPGIKLLTTSEVVSAHKVSKIHIRRPRNQFIIYRQWMSAKIHANNPGVTAACICEFFPTVLFWTLLTLSSANCGADVAG